ncbi:glycosyl transferase [Leifsonia sp. NPDC102414]|uniref:glycosyl transferase n=1 Tax=Leifsonia sp. NPDC102414 TaxID=3364124 RepID=UPI00381206F5
MTAAERIVVQQSFPDPRPTTNPYIIMLRDSLLSTPGVELRTFSWRRALLGRHDVFHAHWPEILVAGQSRLKALVRQGLFVLLMWKLTLTRTPIVRTAHNLQLPTGISRRERALLRWFDRRTTLRIRLNPTTEFAPGVEYATILHGHYRDWFASYPKRAPQQGRIGYFGLIRRYKGVEELLDVFRSVPGDDLRLDVAGKPSTGELAASLLQRAERDQRVAVTLAFLDDAEIVDLVTGSSLIALPYREMHNSGGALTALSLDRPILVPDNATTEALADEVGHAWVHRYSGDLTPDALAAAVESVTASAPTGRPDLSDRDWAKAGEQHAEAYRLAIALAGGTAARRRAREHHARAGG